MKMANSPTPAVGVWISMKCDPELFSTTFIWRFTFFGDSMRALLDEHIAWEGLGLDRKMNFKRISLFQDTKIMRLK